MRGGDVQVCPRFLRHPGRCRYRDRQSVRRPTTLASRECGISTSCRWGRPPTPTSEGRGWRGATRSNYGPLCASTASTRDSFPGRSVKHVCPGSPFSMLDGSPCWPGHTLPNLRSPIPANRTVPQSVFSLAVRRRSRKSRARSAFRRHSVWRPEVGGMGKVSDCRYRTTVSR